MPFSFWKIGVPKNDVLILVISFLSCLLFVVDVNYFFLDLELYDDHHSVFCLFFLSFFPLLLLLIRQKRSYGSTLLLLLESLGRTRDRMLFLLLSKKEI